MAACTTTSQEGIQRQGKWGIIVTERRLSYTSAEVAGSLDRGVVSTADVCRTIQDRGLVIPIICFSLGQPPYTLPAHAHDVGREVGPGAVPRVGALGFGEVLELERHVVFLGAGAQASVLQVGIVGFGQRGHFGVTDSSDSAAASDAWRECP